jgi:hypothetical protein
MTTSLLYVCLDGLGDDPIPAFDGAPARGGVTPQPRRARDARSDRDRPDDWT